MIKKRRRFLAVVSVLLMAFTIILVNTILIRAETSIATSGICGAEGNEENVTWEFDKDSGILTISGTGAMADNVRPWSSHAKYIKKIVIEEGITEVGNGAFCDLQTNESVEFPKRSLNRIGEYAFSNNRFLRELTIPKSVVELGDNIFSGCGISTITIPGSISVVPSFGYCLNLQTVIFEEGVELVESNAFTGCDYVKSLYFPSSLEKIEIQGGISSSYGGKPVVYGKSTAAEDFAYVNDFIYVDATKTYDLKDCEITVDGYVFFYNGDKIKPSVNVKCEINNVEIPLYEGQDYILEYSNNVDAGEATITITGNGCYLGSNIANFMIQRRDINKYCRLIYLGSNNYYYTGKEFTPSVYMERMAVDEFWSSEILTNGVDYTVEYENNKEVGQAAVIITGIGEYCGTIKYNFQILKPNSGSVIEKPSTGSNIPVSRYYYNFDTNKGDAIVVNREMDHGTGTSGRGPQIPEPDASSNIKYGNGKIGKALDLDGSYGLQLPVGRLGESYTISFWVKTDVGMESFMSILWAGRSVDDNAAHWLSITKRDDITEIGGAPLIWSHLGSLVFPWYCHQNIEDVSQNGWLYGDAVTEKSGWQHIILTVDANRTAEYGEKGLSGYYEGAAATTYIDGEFYGTGCVVKGIYDSDETKTYLGINPWDKRFKGYIDEVAFYSQSVSAIQAKGIYEQSLKGGEQNSSGSNNAGGNTSDDNSSSTIGKPSAGSDSPSANNPSVGDNAFTGTSSDQASSEEKGKDKDDGEKRYKKGDIFVKGNYKYTITDAKTNKVELTKPIKSSFKKISIPSIVAYKGVKYKVTAIGKKAFCRNKKLKSIIIGKNVKEIGKNAFYGCKILKTITIKAKSIINVKKNAIKGIAKKAVIKVSPKLLKKYKKKFNSGTGYKKTMSLRKK